MIKLSHITHPAIVDPSSDLVIAQPITLETMRIAKEFVRGTVDVTLYAIQHFDEARFPLPECFLRATDIKRSIGDIKKFEKKRKLALIKDILDPLYEISNTDYFIYTNVDIALQSYFYWTVLKIIEQGYDAFIINRRTIPKMYKDISEIPLMYSELGEKHKGWDCFVFKRSLYPNFKLGTACIGTGWIGRVMITNMACFAKQFKIFTDLHLTFHIGNEKLWKSSLFEDYLEHNKNECRKILIALEQKFGKFDRDKIPGHFLHLLEKKNLSL